VFVRLGADLDHLARQDAGNDAQYLTKQGVQISAIWSMVRRVTGQLN